jgi:hypothetical protein
VNEIEENLGTISKIGQIKICNEIKSTEEDRRHGFLKTEVGVIILIISEFKVQNLLY